MAGVAVSGASTGHDRFGFALPESAGVAGTVASKLSACGLPICVEAEMACVEFGLLVLAKPVASLDAEPCEAAALGLG